MRRIDTRMVEPLDIKTTFGVETDFEGDLEYETSLKILGRFKGQIKTGGYLVIGESAEVEAEIVAGSILIGGTVKGNIEASEKCEILSTGKIYGNIKTNKLKIADGVVFEGNCQMIN